MKLNSHSVLYYFWQLRTILSFLLMVIVVLYTIKILMDCNILRQKQVLLRDEILHYSTESTNLNLRRQYKVWHDYYSHDKFDKEIINIFNGGNNILQISTLSDGTAAIKFDGVKFSNVLDVIHFMSHYYNIYISDVNIYRNDSESGEYVMGNIYFVKRESKGI
ncbi:hypothetical protein [Yersinia sp. 2466 StPb PI]|uniref:hypothetical protein n=1 Tax=Yersinia sp. 2466 StPb PI TaxID=3061648 RepID=UPI00355C7AD5